MPWRAGWTPVMNDDHATGESGGCVVCKRRNAPSRASAAKLGSLPSAIQRSVSAGSMPSKPMITTRRGAEAGIDRRRSARQIRRRGYEASVKAPSTNAHSSMKNEPTNANPAPGPM